jgi:hypothetical protein
MMANLCLTYLSLPGFGVNITDATIEEGILKGFYAFADYAVPFWGLHVVHAASIEDSLLNKHEQEYDELLECLEAFLSLHWVSATVKATVPKTLRQNLSVLQNETIFDGLCQAVQELRTRLRASNKDTPETRVLRIYDQNSSVRRVFEAMVSSVPLERTLESKLTEYYTKLWFKCSRLNCQYYHQGFIDQVRRYQHEDKHDRSFTCTVDGCVQSIIGCVTLKELEKHVFETHGYHIMPPEVEYPDDNLLTRKKPQKEASKHQCPECPRRFTRSHALGVHLSTHGDKRPFICSSCGKAFAREYDCQRHEDLHLGEKKYMCLGTLMNGELWGCKRAFMRSDGLGGHFKSKVGRRKCIRALLEQQKLDGSAEDKQVDLLIGMLPELLEPADDTIVALAAQEASLKEGTSDSRPTLSTASTLLPQEPSPKHPEESSDEESDGKTRNDQKNSRPRLVDQLYDEWKNASDIT